MVSGIHGIDAQFNHAFYAGPSITKNRLLYQNHETQVYTVWAGPAYTLYYNLGYQLKYNLSTTWSLNVELQWKRIGSSRLYIYDQPEKKIQNSWQNYISAPFFVSYKPLEIVSFDLGFTSNYRLDEASNSLYFGPIFNIYPKYKNCYDVLVAINFYLNRSFDFRAKWEEGIDVIDGEFVKGSNLTSVKNRGYHFSLIYKI